MNDGYAATTEGEVGGMLLENGDDESGLRLGERSVPEAEAVIESEENNAGKAVLQRGCVLGHVICDVSHFHLQ